MKNSFAEMTFEELVLKRDELRKKNHELRVKKVMGQINNPLELRTVRRQLARVLTRMYNFDHSQDVQNIQSNDQETQE